jgi:hypothetical protein
MQNYPNPFNPTTNIEYSLPENAEVRLDIYNTIGELVKTLVNQTMEAGYQVISFDASNLPSGTYIYQVKATPVLPGGRQVGGQAKGQINTFIDSKKMMLVK